MITVESILQKIELKNQARDGDKSALAKLKSMAQMADYAQRKELNDYINCILNGDDKQLNHFDNLDKLRLKLAKKLDKHYKINQAPVWIKQPAKDKVHFFDLHKNHINYYEDLLAKSIEVI